VRELAEKTNHDPEELVRVRGERVVKRVERYYGRE
jgi:hypothetical protein